MIWPNERQAVTLGLFMLIVMMMVMAWFFPELWKISVFTDVLKLLVTTGLLNMVLAYHFAANKSDQDKTDNTRAAFEAIKATADSKVPELPRDDSNSTTTAQ